jgi:hypothetical protein
MDMIAIEFMRVKKPYQFILSYCSEIPESGNQGINSGMGIRRLDGIEKIFMHHAGFL